jgi:MFS family permease
MADTISSDLMDRIHDKRRQLDTFIAAAVPRKRRLLNTTIVGGTLAATMTAAPAIGGAPFTSWLTMLLGASSPSWRILCGLASIASLMATIATQLLKSNNLDERVTRALACRAKLEVIETGLVTGAMAQAAATTEFMRCVEEAAFLDA